MAETDTPMQAPNFAGAFYPAEPEALTHTLDELLIGHPVQTPNPPKVIVVPHAGYRYSGATAAAAIRELRGKIGRIVLLGPTHRYSFDGIAFPEVRHFELPNGVLACDFRAWRRVANLPYTVQDQRAFENEHSIEVELPMLRHFLDRFSIAPFVVGRATSSQVKELINLLWGDGRTVFVVSTDLSHFHDLKTAAKLDLGTAKHIEMKMPSKIGHQEACGWVPLRGMLMAAKERQVRFTRLGLTNSREVTGDKSRVVGYGAWVGHTNENAEYSRENQKTLYGIAAKAIHHRLKTGKHAELVNYTHGHLLQSYGASFITLEIDNKLRGCVGTLRAHQPLINDVLKNADKAAFSDPRMSPVEMEEFEHLQCEIAVLDAPARLAFANRSELLSKLEDRNDGVILHYKEHYATFLPKVWEEIDDVESFLKALLQKAGLESDFWDDNIEIQTYSTERFSKVLLKDML